MQSHNTFIVRAVRRLPLYSVIVWWLLPTSAVAQQSEKQDTTLQRSVVVEQTYTLQIGEARKVNILPPIPELSSHPRAVEYSLRQHPIENVPQSPTAHALARTETPLPAPGYLRIGYGNNGNADVLGNYTFRLSGRDRLNISGSFNGMNAKLPMQSAYPDMPTKWAHRFYSTRIGADYLHNFSGISLGVSGTFGVDNYNFLPLSLFSRQRNTQADARLALSSTNEDAPMQYVINLQYLTFQRHSVADDIDQDLTPENGLLRENQLRLSVDFWSPVTEESRIGIAGQAEQRTYDWEKYKNPLFVQLTPYYLLTSGLWNIRLGMHVMFQSGMEKTLRVAPDVYAGLTIAERVTLFAQATGGVVSNDQRQLLRINPFAMSHRTQLENSFETYHARLGIKAGFNGIGIRADAGLGEMRNALIDRNSSSGIIFDPTSEAPAANMQCPRFANEDLLYWDAGGSLSYDHKDKFSFALAGRYYHWQSTETYDGSDNYNPVGSWRPRFRINARVYARLTTQWTLNIEYEYAERQMDELGSINDLGVRATFALLPNVSLYARFGNLLDSRGRYYLDWTNHPSQGIHFVGGLVFSL